MAEKILRKEIKEGDSVVVDINIEGNVAVLNQKIVTREDLSVSFIDSHGNPLANENR